MAISPQEIVVSCLAAFFAWTTLIHWIPSLRLIPYAFLLGFITAILGFLYIIATTSRDLGRVLTPPRPTRSLLFTSPKSWERELRLLKRRAEYVKLNIWDGSVTIAAKLGELIDLILRDFVKSWYSKISAGTDFTNEVDRSVRLAVRNILVKSIDIDLAGLVVTRIGPILNSHFRSFAEAEHAIRGRNLDLKVTESEELDIAIASRYRDGRLHPAASLGPSRNNALQLQHIRRLVDRLVDQIMPESMMTSHAVLVLVREILACAVLQPSLQALSDPDILNQMIEGYGRSVIYERKTVRRLRAALDEHATPITKSRTASTFPQLTPRDNEKTYQAFLTAIRQCQNLSDARRFRSEIIRQLRKHASLPSQDSIYLLRLENGRRSLDHKLTQLSSASPTRPRNNRVDSENIPPPQAAKSKDPTLRHVLYDPSGLSYFMEYMDRHKVMTLVQFWVVVDGMRNPLENKTIGVAAQPSEARGWSQTDRQDIFQISQAYIGKLELNVDSTVQRVVRAFLASGNKATWEQYVSARQALLSVQDDVFLELNEKYFPGFRKSDLFYKWLASESGTPALTVTSTPNTATTSDSAWSSPMHPRRDGSQPAAARLKQPDLRRAIASSGDLPTTAMTALATHIQPRSIDGDRGRRPLFGDEDDDDNHESLIDSVQSLDSDTFAKAHDDLVNDQSQVVAAVQAALDDIVDEKPDKTSSFLDRVNSPPLPTSPESPRGSFDFGSRDGTISSISSPSRVTSPFKDRPSLASLGLLGTPARPTVFNKEDLFGESEKLWEDELEETERDTTKEEGVHEAAPGDLGLTELVHSLTVEINKLEAQQNILDALTRKAELTNNAAELKILRKSKTSLDREIRRKELQRQQYIVQEADNNLYSRATISIKSIMIGTEEDGHEFALYVIEVQRQAGEKAPAVTWAIARRYSEFHDLHKRLRLQHPTIKDLDFPRRQMVLTLQKDFLKKRRAALEKYLRELLARPQICRSIEFRAFLSQQAIRPISNTSGKQVDRQDFITRIYSSVTDGMEEFLGNMPVIDQLSVAGQNLISAATALPSPSIASSANASNPLSSSFINDPRTAAEAEAEITALETRDPAAATFIKPICDIFLELFQLNQSNNWLRGRALVVVLQQLLGGTIERKVRESFKHFTTEEAVARDLDMLRELLWPGGTFRTSPPARISEQKARSRREAGLVLASLLPDVAGGVVGRGNAVQAGRKIFATLNNERLNQHLVYTILDEVVEQVFGVRV